jgi:Rrf2 family protein
MRALMHLALLDERRSTCAQLADVCDVPRSFAHKILKKMVDAGLVASQTGPSGGFSLCRDPERIPLGDVVNAVQGSVSVNRCMLDVDACARVQTCQLSPQLRGLQDTIDSFLRRTTLHDILTALDSIPAERRKTGRGGASGPQRNRPGRNCV